MTLYRYDLSWLTDDDADEIFDALNEFSDELYYRIHELPDDYTDEDREGMSERLANINSICARMAFHYERGTDAKA